VPLLRLDDMNTPPELEKLQKLAIEIGDCHAATEHRAELARKAAYQAVTATRLCGKALMEAKELVGEGGGNWHQWLQKHCGAVGERTAQKAMSLAADPVDLNLDLERACLLSGIISEPKPTEKARRQLQARHKPRPSKTLKPPLGIGLSELSKLTGYSRMHLYRMACKSRTLWTKYSALGDNDQAQLLQERGADMHMPPPDIDQAAASGKRRFFWVASPKLQTWIDSARRQHRRIELSRHNRSKRKKARQPGKQLLTYYWDTELARFKSWLTDKQDRGRPVLKDPGLINALKEFGRIGQELEAGMAREDPARTTSSS
jgi:hypothetical protein